MAGKSKVVSRRQFVTTMAQAGAMVAAPMIVPSSVVGQGRAPSDRIVMGAIGIGGRGRTDLLPFLIDRRVQFVAICDVREERREVIKSLADAINQNRDCAMYRDAQELLARSDIDAVLIATGDRWHALMSIMAAQAGKDVYCEKPCSMTIAESLALADNFRRYGRVYQAGTQRRNGDNFAFAVELARSGKLGKLQTVHANAGTGSNWPPTTSHNWLPAEPEPAVGVVDWDRWLGPSPWRPYNSQYVQGRWRNYFDFHGGGILEWCSHTSDLCQWAADADGTQPVEYEPQPPDPRGYSVHCRYANGVRHVMRDYGWMGLGSCSVRLEGDNGWVETGDGGKIEVSANLRSELRAYPGARGDATHQHVADFINCVRSRSQPRAHADAACNTHIACHAAYIAWQLGRKLTWDPEKLSFVKDEEANRMRSRAMREPWRLESISQS